MILSEGDELGGDSGTGKRAEIVIKFQNVFYVLFPCRAQYGVEQMMKTVRKIAAQKSAESAGMSASARDISHFTV